MGPKPLFSLLGAKQPLTQQGQYAQPVFGFRGGLGLGSLEPHMSLFTRSFVVRPSNDIAPPASAKSFEYFRSMGKKVTDLEQARGPAFADVWYHHAALAKMYSDMNRPIPDTIMEWSKAQVDYLDAMSVIEPEQYLEIPLLKLITAYGIYYGVHGHLEAWHLATGKVTHHNVVDICRRMATVMSMREFLNQNWDHLLDSTASWVTPPRPMGCHNIKCTFALSPSFEGGYPDGCGSLRSDIVPKQGMHRLLMETEMLTQEEWEKVEALRKTLERNVDELVSMD